MNLTELLDRSAGRWPQKPVLIEGGNTVSYGGLLQQVAEISLLLQTLEVPPGSRVGLCLSNSIQYVALTFALWKINAVVVPMPTEYTEAELLTLAETLLLSATISHKPRAGSQPLLGDLFFTRLTPAAPPDNHGLNIAFIRFTSGTTNTSKGVVLTHETIRDRVAASNQSLGITAADTVMWCLPMSHHFLVTIVLYLSVGATIVLARHVLARPFLEAVNQAKGTMLYAAPFHYALLARDNSGAKISTVRLAVSTTCALPPDVAEDFFKRFGVPLTQALGLIELGLPCVNVEDPAGRWNSVGRPQLDYQIRIRNPDRDGCGEVVISGPGFFDAYDSPWTPREKLMPDGWFVTGDLGRLDENGFLFLAGRKTAVINLAGRKVFPEEIEAVLNRHPAVREARVHGEAHPHLGEVVAAEVVLHHAVAPEVLRDFCRAQLGPDKVPASIHFVNAIAKTAVTGKIRRPAAVAA